MTIFTGFQHVVSVVRDIQAAAADWERCFSAQAERYGEDGHSARVRFAVGGSWIVLAQPLSERSPYWEFLHTRGQGVCAAALQVRDVGGAVRMVQARGAPVTWDEGSEYAWVDPAFANGVGIELWPEGPRAEGPSLFRRFHHLVVATQGTESAAANWHRLFDRETEPEASAIPMTSHIDAGEAYFGLVDGADHPPPVAKFLKERGEGVYIVSVVDDDVTGTVKAVRERGGRIVGDEDGAGQIFVHPATTHGMLLEINDEAYSRNWTATYGEPPFNR